MTEPYFAIAFVSAGTWVAKCPRPWCIHSDHYGPGPNTGRAGGLTLTGFACMYCGLMCDAVWPANAEDIVRVLEQRPQLETRNWMPTESVEDLVLENILHGVLDPRALTRGTVAVDGFLSPAFRRAVAAPPPLAIGA